MKIESAKDLEVISENYSKNLYYPEGVKVNVGIASCGIAAGAQASLEKAAKEFPGNGIIPTKTGKIKNFTLRSKTLC